MEPKIFLSLILGLLVGDYLLQPKLMAIQKSERSIDGFVACWIHCISYTFVTMSFIYNKPVVLIYCLLYTLYWNQAKHIETTKNTIPVYVWVTVFLLILSPFVWLSHNWQIWAVAVTIFLSHWFIDRYSLASLWLKFIKGRDFMSEYKNIGVLGTELISIPFACNVYVIVDNGLHILILYFAFQLLKAHGIM